jgi:hypothetical protein
MANINGGFGSVRPYQAPDQRRALLYVAARFMMVKIDRCAKRRRARAQAQAIKRRGASAQAPRGAQAQASKRASHGPQAPGSRCLDKV